MNRNSEGIPRRFCLMAVLRRRRGGKRPERFPQAPPVKAGSREALLK
jgi:hypothetical protein